MLNNTQLPFSFQRRPSKRVSPKPYRTSYSRNIRGLCENGHSFQRVKLHDAEGKKIVPYCPTCAKDGIRPAVIRVLPDTMRPWKLLDRQKDYDGYLDIRFNCQGCNTNYINFATFGALCQHKNHTPPGGWLCRFCCIKDDPKPETPNKQARKNLKKAQRGIDQAFNNALFGFEVNPPQRIVQRVVDMRWVEPEPWLDEDDND